MADNGTLAGWDDEGQDWADAKPLDLAAIRSDLAYLRRAYWRVDAPALVIARVQRILQERVPALLAEVERLRREQSVELANANARADILTEQVEALRANQLPDGGTWRVEYGHDRNYGICWCARIQGVGVKYSRRVFTYTGPVEPITDETASAAT